MLKSRKIWSNTLGNHFNHNFSSVIKILHGFLNIHLLINLTQTHTCTMMDAHYSIKDLQEVSIKGFAGSGFNSLLKSLSRLSHYLFFFKINFLKVGSEEGST